MTGEKPSKPCAGFLGAISLFLMIGLVIWHFAQPATQKDDHPKDRVEYILRASVIALR